MVAPAGFNLTLKTLLSLFTAVGVVISFLSFSIGRASVVSEFRREISETYVARSQYVHDQNQAAAITAHNYQELRTQMEALREDQRAIILLLTRNRKVVADSLRAEPD